MDGIMVKEKTYREENLAKVLQIPVADVFKKIEIPTNKLELAHRINKMKALGLDCSLEESIRVKRLVEDQVGKIEEILTTGAELKPEHVEELTGKLQGVINGLQRTS